MGLICILVLSCFRNRCFLRPHLSSVYWLHSTRPAIVDCVNVWLLTLVYQTSPAYYTTYERNKYCMQDWKVKTYTNTSLLKRFQWWSESCQAERVFVRQHNASHYFVTDGLTEVHAVHMWHGALTDPIQAVLCYTLSFYWEKPCILVQHFSACHPASVSHSRNCNLIL